ncbi:MAG TPA: PEP-CTERM sorting domain-containing protein [Phycisphaerae bacterium]|nr:PEP-CTERM sorting domain-containing protein [Phycisphaerae bacterium]
MSSSASAVSVAEWDVAGNASNASKVSVLSTANGVSATDITATGVNVLRAGSSKYAGVFCSNHWATSEVRDTSKYYSWSITDTVGYDLTSIVMSLSRGKYEDNDNPDEPYGASKWDLYVNDQLVGTIDLDNYDGNGTAAQPDEPIVWTVDLTSVLSASLYVFKLYGYSDEGGSDYAGLNESWYSHSGTNVTLYGSAVPEPLTVLSVMLGCSGLGYYLKKRLSNIF